MKRYSFGSAFYYSAYYLWDSSILLSNSFLFIAVWYPIVRTLALTMEEPLLDGILLSGWWTVSCLHLLLACFTLVVSNPLPLQTVGPQAPLAMGFSRQEYWSGLSFPTPGDLPNPGIEPTSLASPGIGRQILYHCTTWEAPQFIILNQLKSKSLLSKCYVVQSRLIGLHWWLR